jgi:glycogen synthase
MSIINISLLAISDEWGGGQEVVYQLAKHLINYDVDVSLITNDEIKDHYSDIKKLRIYSLGTIDNKSKYSYLLSYYKMRMRLSKLLGKIHIDLMHLHLGGSLYVSFGLTNRFNIPTLLSLHGPEVRNYFNRTSLLDLILFKYAFLRAKTAVSPSNWQIAKLGINLKSKIIVIPNGVDTREFKPLDVRRETVVILFVGRFVELKGIRDLLKVARSLTQYEFWFVGTGPLHNEINLPNTKNLGFKNKEELIKLYNKSTICCFPSHYESFGIAALEAMSCGHPLSLQN